MWRNLLVGTMLIALSGCDRTNPIQEIIPNSKCDDNFAKSLVKDIISSESLKIAKTHINDRDNTIEIQGRLSSAISRIGIVIDDVRTEKDDPDSTKSFCKGNLVVTVPPSILADADEANGFLNAGTADAALLAAGLEKLGENFTAPFSFSVQPTDAGDKIFAEVEGLGTLFQSLGDIASSYALLPAIKMQAAKMQEEQVALLKEKEFQATRQKEADLGMASAENKLVNQEINELWVSFQPDIQSRLITLQRSWVDKKTADCNVKASGESDPLVKETVRLRCDTEYTRERTRELASVLIR